MANSDFVSLHCPLNDVTRGLINKDNLKLMKPTAYLVNISRGGLVVEEHLIEALENQVRRQLSRNRAIDRNKVLRQSSAARCSDTSLLATVTAVSKVINRPTLRTIQE